MTLGIGIMSFDRPDYLRHTLAGLLENDLTECDVWLFQDGWQCKFTDRQMGSPEGIDACIAMFCDAFPNGKTMIQNKNIGIALNRIVMLDMLSARYLTWLTCEDDVILAPQYVTLVRKLLAEFADETDIGFLRSPLEPPSDGQVPNALYRSTSANSAIAARREWFAPVRARYEEFAEVWRQYPYVPHEKYWQIMLDRYGNQMLCSSDVALTWSANEVKRYGWTLGAPRTRSIGVRGVHCTGEIFNRRRMGEVVLQEYEGELTEHWVKAVS